MRRSPELPSRRRPQKPSVGGRWQIPKNRLRLCDLYYGVSGESQLKPIVRAIGCAGLINRLLVTIEWLSYNGSCYVGDETRRFASNRERCQSKVHRAMEGPKPSSVRSNVTMSASVRARMQRPSCTKLSASINHYNEVHPHKALGYRSPREFIAAHGSS